MKRQVIKCPKCGAEYMAGEIYLPEYFIGQPNNIIKGYDHNILSYNGSDMDVEEQYQCDYCDCKFKVSASVTFRTGEIKEVFDEDEYVSKGE